MTLFVVNGAPGSGKSTVCAQLPIPVIAKDTIKEALFDIVGWGTRELSQRIGAKTWDMLFAALPTILEAGPVAIDANLQARSHDRIRALNVDVVEFRCVAPPDVVVERFERRWESGQRHRGHVDNEFDVRRDLDNYPPLSFALRVEVDTSTRRDISELLNGYDLAARSPLDVWQLRSDLAGVDLSGWPSTALGAVQDVIVSAVTDAGWKLEERHEQTDSH